MITRLISESASNDVYATGLRGCDKAFDRYDIVDAGVNVISDTCLSVTIPFKNRNRFGVTESDLLYILENRLAGLQNGDRKCQEYADARTHILAAMVLISNRTKELDRLRKLGGDRNE